MSIKRQDTPEAAEFWDFVERVARNYRAKHPTGPPCDECGRELNELSISAIRGVCRFCAPVWAQEVQFA